MLGLQWSLPPPLSKEPKLIQMGGRGHRAGGKGGGLSGGRGQERRGTRDRGRGLWDLNGEAVVRLCRLTNRCRLGRCASPPGTSLFLCNAPWVKVQTGSSLQKQKWQEVVAEIVT